MTIQLVNYGTRGELMLDGRLDSNTADEAAKIFMENAERFDTLVMDMTRLAYISSAGLRVVRQVHIAMKKKGGEFIIRHASRMVMEVFEMTGLVGLFHFE